MNILEPVRAMATGNVDIANPGTAVFDGVELVEGDRLLLGFQTAATENLVYVFHGDAQPLTAAQDFDEAEEVIAGTFVVVRGGSQNAGPWKLGEIDDPFVVGTSTLQWSLAAFDDIVLKRGEVLPLSFENDPATGMRSDTLGEFSLFANGVEVMRGRPNSPEFFRIHMRVPTESPMVAPEITWQGLDRAGLKSVWGGPAIDIGMDEANDEGGGNNDFNEDGINDSGGKDLVLAYRGDPYFPGIPEGSWHAYDYIYLSHNGLMHHATTAAVEDSNLIPVESVAGVWIGHRVRITQATDGTLTGFPYVVSVDAVNNEVTVSENVTIAEGVDLTFGNAVTTGIGITPAWRSRPSSPAGRLQVSPDDGEPWSWGIQVRVTPDQNRDAWSYAITNSAGNLVWGINGYGEQTSLLVRETADGSTLLRMTRRDEAAYHWQFNDNPLSHNLELYYSTNDQLLESVEQNGNRHVHGTARFYKPPICDADPTSLNALTLKNGAVEWGFKVTNNARLTLRYLTGGVDIWTAAYNGLLNFPQPVRTDARTVAQLNTGFPPVSAGIGARSMVTDSLVDPVGNFGAPVTGGGGFKTPVWCDGTAWRIG